MFEMMAGRSPFDIITDNPDMNTEDYLFQGTVFYPSPRILLGEEQWKLSVAAKHLELSCLFFLLSHGSLQTYYM